MNFLAHHALARRLAPERPPAFFVGNILPDLVAAAGTGRLRARHVESDESELALGVRLHLMADRHFHQDPAFLAAMDLSGALLRRLPAAPRRVFFLAHVAAELALDSALLRADPGLADDLIRQVENSPAETIARTTALWLGIDAAPIAASVLGFARSGYVRHYVRGEGLAEGLHRIALRAGLDGFSEEVRAALAERMPQLAAQIADQANDLLKRAGGAWYNSGVENRSG